MVIGSLTSAVALPKVKADTLNDSPISGCSFRSTVALTVKFGAVSAMVTPPSKAPLKLLQKGEAKPFGTLQAMPPPRLLPVIASKKPMLAEP